MITDFRDITHGTNIPSFAYADQPEIVAAPDGALVCAVTTALGNEGAGSTFVGDTVRARGFAAGISSRRTAAARRHT